ncbi:Protein CBG26067 [Caenorhabditis briggsae]|uniref:Protein CBG26067 n=1 Tax=Caenorhabditis briggsae TaxID=6238 RepID=B6ILQ0_CAEBR|nr:Protein CBG26067 [Caenorhabditis briggsae]CAS00830.1 Protein CBG26067 [Caenorhabditis briggsae]
MRNVRIGLAGMLISVWVIIAAVFTRDSLNYWKISHTSYQIAMFSIPAFMALFSSKYKKHFLQIDFNKFSYHKMVQIVVVIGIIHVSFAAYFIQSSIAYLLILILTIASFIFSVDLYTLMTAKSYRFREHYHYDRESQEILYHEEIV